MRFINFLEKDGAHLGVRLEETVVDLTVAAPGLPRDLGALFAAGTEAIETARKAAKVAAAGSTRKFADLHLLPPVHQPGKVVCLGTNYLAHVLESTHLTGQSSKTDFPPIFLRGPSSLVGHGQPIVRPVVSNDLDYECELAVIIGKIARHVKVEDALSFVGGYACFNDGSIRDFQLRTSQWTLGKNFDKTGGFGPDCVTPDELPEGAKGLRIQTRLNGQVLQDSNTSLMIFGVAEAIAILTECLTLNPGDVVVMGTCEGVGLVRKPPLYMKPGDVCEVEIERIGTLVNAIGQESL
jgi:2-keto-4-pentenoate hydratase/2-oxohepta-3-ene-1,7-dioic acid hydratase in catechol pathway